MQLQTVAAAGGLRSMRPCVCIARSCTRAPALPACGRIVPSLAQPVEPPPATLHLLPFIGYPAPTAVHVHAPPSCKIPYNHSCCTRARTDTLPTPCHAGSSPRRHPLAGVPVARVPCLGWVLAACTHRIPPTITATQPPANPIHRPMPCTWTAARLISPSRAHITGRSQSARIMLCPGDIACAERGRGDRFQVSDVLGRKQCCLCYRGLN